MSHTDLGSRGCLGMRGYSVDSRGDLRVDSRSLNSPYSLKFNHVGYYLQTSGLIDLEPQGPDRVEKGETNHLLAVASRIKFELV